MFLYLGRRLSSLFLVWAAVLVVTFIAIRLTPGDPITLLMSDQAGNVQLEAQLRSQYGLDESWPRQFVTYLGSIADGTLGYSYRYAGVPVSNVIAGPLMITPVLGLLAILLAAPIGVAIGVFSAMRANTWADSATAVILVLIISVPSFVIAAVMIYVFSIRLGWLPVAGWGTPKQLIMPVIVLAIHPATVIARLMRTYMLEVLGHDFIRTARAKGMRERLVIWREAFGNTMVPLATTIGLIFGSLISGAIVVETVFNIPGIGRLAINSIMARDYPVIMAVVLISTVFCSLINLAVDMLYGVIDPRIRLEA